jgi:pimeloyl-ACP methyl ester carboxylesterase
VRWTRPRLLTRHGVAVIGTITRHGYVIIAAMAPGLHVVRAGTGPRILCIHGAAADHTTWSIQLASALRRRFALIAYDRRDDALTIEDHADDAAAVLADAPGPAVVVGSSFGGVVALELVRRHRSQVAGAVLIEPPLAASDAPPATPSRLLDDLDRRAAQDGAPAAAELFMRRVLGDAAFERMPRRIQDRATSKFAQIRADSVALLAYRPRYTELPGIATPVLLLGGGRSAPSFRPTLEALQRSLGRARLEILDSAGHMLHAQAPRRFGELLAGFAAESFGELAPP